MRYLALLGAVLLFAGCGPPPPPKTPAQIELELQQFGSEKLPVNAKKVMDLGNGWKTFELEIDGKNRKFIYRQSKFSGGHRAYSSEAITEISPESLP